MAAYKDPLVVLNLLDVPIPACFGETSGALLTQPHSRLRYAKKAFPLLRICIGVSIVRSAALRLLVLRAFCKHIPLYAGKKPLQLCLLFKKLVPLHCPCLEFVGLIADRVERVAERLKFRPIRVEMEGTSPGKISPWSA